MKYIQCNYVHELVAHTLLKCACQSIHVNNFPPAFSFIEELYNMYMCTDMLYMCSLQ